MRNVTMLAIAGLALGLVLLDRALKPLDEPLGDDADAGAAVEQDGWITVVGLTPSHSTANTF